MSSKENNKNSSVVQYGIEKSEKVNHSETNSETEQRLYERKMAHAVGVEFIYNWYTTSVAIETCNNRDGNLRKRHLQM